MSTKVEKNSDESNTFVMNGSKMWITNGTVDGTDTGDVFLVYAKSGMI